MSSGKKNKKPQFMKDADKAFAPTPPVKLDPKYNTMAEEMNAVVKRLDTTLTPPRGYESGRVSMNNAMKAFARKQIK